MLNSFHKISNVKIKVSPFTVTGSILLNTLHKVESYLKVGTKMGTK